MSINTYLDKLIANNKCHSNATSIRDLLSCAESSTEADFIMKTSTYFETDDERIAYLADLFKIDVHNSDNRHDDYIKVLKAVVSKRQTA